MVSVIWAQNKCIPLFLDTLLNFISQPPLQLRCGHVTVGPVKHDFQVQTIKISKLLPLLLAGMELIMATLEASGEVTEFCETVSQ